MTAIIGFADKGSVYIGADSIGVGGYGATVRSDEKVFKNGPFIIGFTTSFRMGQLLRYNLSAPKRPDDCPDDMTFMVRHFIPAITEVFRFGGFLRIDHNQHEGGVFLVGYRGKLYAIYSDFQVAIADDGIMAVGAGEEVALGAMYALDSLPPRARIVSALKITERLNIAVRGPFRVLEQKAITK